jgi:hypothetical protein
MEGDWGTVRGHLLRSSLFEAADDYLLIFVQADQYFVQVASTIGAINASESTYFAFN